MRNYIPSPFLLTFLIIFIHNSFSSARGDGLLHVDGRVLFAIGMYELPESDQELERMAAAGINIVRCHSIEDLDRARNAGLYGWVPLPVHKGVTDNLREKIISLKDHPALALWEGPDEIVWNFTAYSGLARRVGVKKSDWFGQKDNAVKYAADQASTIIPNIRDAVQLVRELDDKDRQFWINEARDSDPLYVRRILRYIDITGCDDYPVRSDSPPEEIARIGPSTDRWVRIANGKPVYMVLQAFAWTELNRETADQKHTYPTYEESRFMAYDAIVRGARGLMYWGSHYLQSEEFRKSLYRLTSELASLQRFLTGAPEPGITVRLLERSPNGGEGIHVCARRYNRDWLIIIVNEDNQRHMGVEINGLTALEGNSLKQLSGPEEIAVAGGQILTRMTPLSVKVFVTNR